MSPSERGDCGVQVVLVTAPDRDVAGRLAADLVERRLAACVNLLPGIRSIYRWQGETHDDEEVLLVIKTEASRFDALAARVREIHPYDVPEILGLDVAAGDPAYLDWVRAETRT